MWWNGTLLGTSATALVPADIYQFAVGANAAGGGPVPLTAGRLYIGAHTSDIDEHLAHWNNSMFAWQNRAGTVLQMRSTDYDIGNVRTLDSSGNGMHFQLGDGANPATYPTQGVGLMSFDGAQWLQSLADVPQPVGAYSVAVTLRDSTGLTGKPVFSMVDDANNDTNMMLLLSGGQWRFNTGGGFVRTGDVRFGVNETLVCTWDGAQARIYRNGVDAVAATVNVPAQPSGAPKTMRIASRANTAERLIGDIHDFQIIDGIALTPTQVLDYTLKMQQRLGREV